MLDKVIAVKNSNGSKRQNFKISNNPKLNRIITATIFDEQIYNSVYHINKQIDNRHELRRFWQGHVAGIKNLVHEKPIDMAILFLDIISGKANYRLKAVQRIKEESENYQNLEMPLNTPRVLIDLINEVVKEGLKGPEQRNVLKQCRLIADFNEALSGRATVIRRILNQQGLPEITEPKSGEHNLDQKKYYTGWDDLVYDNLSSGRKTPAHIMISAFGKGQSKITIAQDDFTKQQLLNEALRAGKLLEIDVHLGIEYIVKQSDRHFHQLVLFENCTEPEDYAALCKDVSFSEFQSELAKNVKSKTEIMKELLETFNARHLSKLNQEILAGLTPLRLLNFNDLKDYARGRKIHHVYLGRFLYKTIADHLNEQRKLNPALAEVINKIISQIKPEILQEKYIDEIYFNILKKAFFVTAEQTNEILTRLDLKNSRGENIKPRIVFVRPLEHGLKAAMEYIIQNYQYIQAVEIWNNRITTPDYKENTLKLNKFRELLNKGDLTGVKLLLDAQKVIFSDEIISAAVEHYSKIEPLNARFASGSDGNNPFQPGMGMIKSDNVRNGRDLSLVNNVELLPFIISDENQIRNFLGVRDVRNAPLGGNILPLGNRLNTAQQNVDQEIAIKYSVWDYVKDLNKDIKNVFKIIGGFVISFGVDHLLGLIFQKYIPFALSTYIFWMIYTYGRNFVVNLAVKSGIKPWRWKLQDLDRNNAANSVFFSLQSIPLIKLWEYLLRFHLIDYNDSGDPENFYTEIAKRALLFFSVAMFNGLYIYGHNTLRGFTADVKNKNTWRSFLAFPVALGLSYIFTSIFGPLPVQLFWGFILTPVVINKIASDTVGGLIEGDGQMRKEYERSKKVLKQMLPALKITGKKKSIRQKKMQSLLDIMYIWKHAGMAWTALKDLIRENNFTLTDFKVFNQPLNKREEYENYIAQGTWKDKEIIKDEFDDMNVDFDLFMGYQRKKVVRNIKKQKKAKK